MEKPINFTSDFKRMTRITMGNSLGFFFLDFLIPFVANLELGASGSEMGLIFSVRTIGYFVVAPLVGALADRYSNTMLILIGSVGRGLAYFLLYLSIAFVSLPEMIIGNLMLGAFAGFFWIPLDILLSKKSSSESRSEAFGIRDSIIGQGTLVGAVIGFSILTYFDTVEGPFQGNPLFIYSALIIYGLANIFTGVYFYFKVDENLTLDAEEAEKSNDNYVQFFRSLSKPFRGALIFLFIVLFLTAANKSIANPFVLVYLSSNLTQNAFLASIVYLPSGIISALIAPYLGRLADKLNLKWTISLGSVAGAIVTYLLISTDSLVVFAILLVFDSAIVQTVFLVIQNILSRLSKRNRGKIFGLQTLVMDSGFIIGPILGGILWDNLGQRSPFLFSIGIEIFLIPFFIIAITRITPFLSKTVVNSTSTKTDPPI